MSLPLPNRKPEEKPKKEGKKEEEEEEEEEEDELLDELLDASNAAAAALETGDVPPQLGTRTGSKGANELDEALARAMQESEKEHVDEDKQTAMKIVYEDIQHVLKNEDDKPLLKKEEDPPKGVPRPIGGVRRIHFKPSPGSSPQGSPGGRTRINFADLMAQHDKLAKTGTPVTSAGIIIASLPPSAQNAPHTLCVASPGGEFMCMVKQWPKGQPIPKVGSKIEFTGKVQEVKYRPNAEDLANGTTFMHPAYWNSKPFEIVASSIKVEAGGDGTAPIVTLELAQKAPPGSIVSIQVYLRQVVSSDSAEKYIVVDEGEGGFVAIVTVPDQFIDSVSSIAPGTFMLLKNVIRRGHYGEIVRIPFGLNKDSELEFFDPSALDDIPPPLEDEHGNLFAEDGEPATKKRNRAGGK